MAFRTEQVQQGDTATIERVHEWLVAEFSVAEEAPRCQGAPPYPALSTMLDLLEKGYPTFVRWEGNPEEPVSYMVTSVDGIRILWARQRNTDAPFGSPLHLERQARGLVDAHLATGNWIDWAAIGISTPEFLSFGELARARAEEMLLEMQ